MRKLRLRELSTLPKATEQVIIPGSLATEQISFLFFADLRKIKYFTF